MAWPVRVVLVHGPSMVPALHHGDRLLVRLSAPRQPPKPGRIVVVALPERPLSVKRLIGVEADGRLWIEGDNEFASTDSRTLGPLTPDSLRGLVIGRLWPRPRVLWARPRAR